MEASLVYVENPYGEGEAEYDCSDYPHTYQSQDGIVMVASADLGEENNAKLKAFMSTLTYTHG